MEGRLRVRNHMLRSIALEVLRPVSGEIVEVSPEAEVVREATGIGQVNPTHALT